MISFDRILFKSAECLLNFFVYIDHVELSIADPMLCCLDTDWSIDEKSPFKSIFMHKNSRYLSGLSRREKDIADFCFFCNHRPKIE